MNRNHNNNQEKKKNVGKENTDIIDTISGRSDKPKIHYNSQPNEINTVWESVRDYLQENACQIVSQEFASETEWEHKDKIRWTRANEEEENGPCPNGGIGKKDWEDSYVINSKSFKKDKEDFINDSKKGIGYIHNNHLVLEIKNELMKMPEYVSQLNKKSNSIVTYWRKLMEFLSGKISYLRKTSVSNAIRASIKELRVKDCAMDYYYEVEKLLKQYEKKMTEENIAETIANMNEHLEGMNQEERDNAIQLVKVGEAAKVKKKVDEDTEIIRCIYDRLYRFGMDDAGIRKFDQIKSNLDCPSNETPYDNRIVQITVENGVQVRKVTGGLQNMLSEFKKSLDRIKIENPTKKILYTRYKENYGMELKVGDQKKVVPINAEVPISNETLKRKAENAGGGVLKLPRYDIEIFKNKDKSKKPCYYCRDQLVRYTACTTHSYDMCRYNLNGSSKDKFSKEEIDKAWKDAQSLRDLAQKQGLGRQRKREKRNAIINASTTESEKEEE